MDHGGGHGGHDGGHDGGGMEDMCKMNMLFNWDTTNLCVVFESWKIMTPFGLLFSCLAIIGISAGYELLRAQGRRYDLHLTEGDRKRNPRDDSLAVGGASSGEDEVGLLNPRQRTLKLSNQQQLTRSVIYMLQVFVGFFIMLIFMTYNAFLMASVVLGAGVGFFYFGAESLSASKALSCH